MGQRILNIDSQILTGFQSCNQQMKLGFIEHLRQNDKPQALEKGSLMHGIMEAYYSVIGGLINSRSELFNELNVAGVEFVGQSTDCAKVAQFALEAGRYLAVKMALEPDTAQFILAHAADYFKYYLRDTFVPLAVETVGTKVIYEDKDIKFLYTYKIDLIVQKGNNIMAVDHKTSTRRESPTDMENQFLGYVWGLGQGSSIMINRIGLQKTLSPGQRFERFLFTYTQGRIDEWVENTVSTMFDILYAIDNDHFPRNMTSCFKYSSGCQFLAICSSDPQLRDYKRERLYHISTKWDPAEALKGKGNV